jgi:hypothetical protein
VRRVHVRVLAGNDVIVDAKTTTLDAIAQLQRAIEHLRSLSAPTFDASWGEQPMPILGPSAQELAQAS